MGIYDRDYYRQPNSRFGNWRGWPVTTWLIILNCAVFVADGLIQRLTQPPEAILYQSGPLQNWGYFSLDLAIRHAQVWRFFTFQFLHLGLIHLGMNMLGLYYFGPMVESHLGRRRYIAFYLLCGFGGALLYVILFGTGILVENPDTRLLGASASIFGILVAAAIVAPYEVIRLWLPPISLYLRTLVLIFLGISVYVVVMYGKVGAYNAGGEAAHLGGAALGWLLIKNEQWLDFFDRRRPRLKYGGRRVTFRDWRNDPDH
jgi:membrane associated rhomboid family serine protease